METTMWLVQNVHLVVPFLLFEIQRMGSQSHMLSIWEISTRLLISLSPLFLSILVFHKRFRGCLKSLKLLSNTNGKDYVFISKACPLAVCCQVELTLHWELLYWPRSITVSYLILLTNHKWKITNFPKASNRHKVLLI